MMTKIGEGDLPPLRSTSKTSRNLFTNKEASPEQRKDLPELRDIGQQNLIPTMYVTPFYKTNTEEKSSAQFQ